MQTIRICLLLVLLAPSYAFAQLAPVGGHYGGKPNDSGFGGGSVNPAGGYAASVPLDFPPARGGLPIPVQIAYGIRGVGAAGAGWDVPLSFVQRDLQYRERRPSFSPGAAPKANGRRCKRPA